MLSSVDGFRQVAFNLRSYWGITVVEVPGWQRRGVGTLRPRGFVRHHTAGSLQGGRFASLRICTFGRPGLSNALCNWYTPRGAGREVYLVAANVAWHAGTGGWRGLSGNSSVVGLEAENNGIGEKWHSDTLYVARALDYELAKVFNYPVENGCEHKEWSPRRKPDRNLISGPGERERVRGLERPTKNKPTPAPVPKPVPTPPTDPWSAFMSTLNSNQKANLTALANLSPEVLKEVIAVGAALATAEHADPDKRGTGGRSFVEQLVRRHRVMGPLDRAHFDALRGLVDGITYMRPGEENLDLRAATDRTTRATLAMWREAGARGWLRQWVRFRANRTYVPSDLGPQK
jgi:hypothetical protein